MSKFIHVKVNTFTANEFYKFFWAISCVNIESNTSTQLIA